MKIIIDASANEIAELLKILGNEGLIARISESLVRDNRSIKALDLTTRSIHCLNAKNIYYIDELTQHSENELLKMQNLGRKSLNEIKEVLALQGLSLRNENEQALGEPS